MGKQIIFLFDGTAHSADRGQMTHVTRVLTNVYGRANSLPFYTPGVGSKNVKGALANIKEKVFGSLLGVGLDADLENAYIDLCANYAPGDRVYLFGWSRGAYLARSMIGLVRNVGLMPSSLPKYAAKARAAAAVKHYRGVGRGSTPWCEASLQFRADHSPEYTVHRDEIAWRNLHGIDPGQPFQFHYAGLWDTVGVKGMNGLFTQVLANVPGLLRTPFHDNALSSVTMAARHAVALDETSRILPSTLWDRNLKDMNKGNHGPNRPYQQEWFPGTHRVLGGAEGDNGLSNASLHWVLSGAMVQGLDVNPVYMDQLYTTIDPMAPLSEPATKPITKLRRLLFRRILGRHRANVTHYRDVNAVTQKRVLASKDTAQPYQPKALHGMWHTLWLWMTDGEETPPPLERNAINFKQHVSHGPAQNL
ncbi:MAG: phospholipase effector Tle1 domain-containing protein [Planktomarina sp.]